jgi:DNA mismatch repair protein MutS
MKFGRFNKKTLHEEYLCEQEYFEKKYGVGKTIVLIRVGSFYEAYGTDKLGFDLSKLAEVLNAKLARKNSKNGEKISTGNPYMVGFPAVSKQKHVKLLLDNGFTIIIIDQVTPPPNPKREVTEIISPGTYIEENKSPDSNNVVSLYIEDELQSNGQILIAIGMSMIDLTTGKSQFYEVYSINGDEKYALDETVRFVNSNNPNEIIIHRSEDPNTKMKRDKLLAYLELENKNFHFVDKIKKEYQKISYQDKFFETIFLNRGMMSGIEYIDMERTSYARLSYVLLLNFAIEHNPKIVDNLPRPISFENNKHLILGNNAVFQLNVLENKTLDVNQRFRSLFDVINKTSTAMGRRYLRENLIAPLTSINEINLRYDIIETFIKKNKLLEDVEKNLHHIADIERLGRKLTLNMLHPQEFEHFFTSYENILIILKRIYKNPITNKLITNKNILVSIANFIKECEKYFDMDIMKLFYLNDIEDSFLKKGIDRKIDDIQDSIEDNMLFLKNISITLSQYVDDKKSDEIKLQLKKNDRDGYYLSTTNKRGDSLKKNIAKLKSIKITEKLSLNPNELVFKKLPKSGYNITCDKLCETSSKTVDARNKIKEYVKEKYLEILSKVNEKYSSTFHEVSKLISELDFLKSGAKVAMLYNYSKPTIVSKDKAYIKAENLRHPIVERINEDKEYVPVTIHLGIDGLDGILLHGINSSGKSTNMKSIGLSVILAQCGLFVPATKYEFSPYYSLFARITGNDNIFKGLSSFALEMTELRAILKRVGQKTLVIGDEVCRGTEQISGNAIVTATIIKLSESNSSFIFATHLHKIAKMDKIKALGNIAPYHLTVSYDEDTDSLTFDRILKKGQGPDVYGLTVARYIIQDNDFMKLANSICEDLEGEKNEILSDKKSKYNSKVYLNKCQICNKKMKKHGELVNYLDTHHINFQKDCENGFVKNKPHLRKNSEANLSVLCKTCHDSVHTNDIQILGYKDTSNGKKLDFKVKNKKIKKVSNEVCQDGN